MIIVVRLFVRSLLILSLSSIAFIRSFGRPYSTNGRNVCIAFQYICMRVHACAYSLANEQACSLAWRHTSYHGMVVLVVVVAIYEMIECMKGIEKGERERIQSGMADNNDDFRFVEDQQMHSFTHKHSFIQSRLAYRYNTNDN